MRNIKNEGAIKVVIKIIILGCFFLMVKVLIAQDVIDVVEQGISVGVRNSKQQDRDEAIMNAKLKIIERAGVDVKSITSFDGLPQRINWIKKQSQAYILPGLKIVDVGYDKDGLYHIVLVGKISTIKTKGKNRLVGIEWIFIKGGTFHMGDTFGNVKTNELPVHNVTVSDFYLSKTEVTVTQYRAFCEATNRQMVFLPCWDRGKENPITNVMWYDAKAFCDWAGCRLPTEAEWEYAAKGGIESRGYKYSGSDSLQEVAWCEINSDMRTHPVGIKLPNEIGLYDMCGNVSEWCSDWYEDYHCEPQINPKGHCCGLKHVLRGGSWLGSCTMTDRYIREPCESNYAIGFRCAKSVKP